MAEQIGQEYTKQLENTSYYDYDYNDNIPDFSKIMLDTMIKALFSRYFEFDDKRFFEDGMIAASIDDPRDLDAETAPAFNRWQNPLASYVKEK